MHRTLIVLTIAQSMASCGTPIVILLGGIVGTRIAPSPDLATLPIALMIVGTALTTIPAAMLMKAIGRKFAFIFAASYCLLAGLLAAHAISQNSFVLFCIATFLVGSHNAFVQQYRFAVAESVPSDRVAKSLSILMLAGVVAAFMGPETAQQLQYASAMGEFSGSFLGISALMVGVILTLSFYRNAAPRDTSTDSAARTLIEISMQGRFLLAIAAAAVGWSVMSLIMTATPVAMHEVDQFNLEDTTFVIQSHIVAMFLPSVFSGILVTRFGAENIVKAGLLLLGLCLAIAWWDRHFIHYWGALVLLGVGWNFLFLGGTTLLTSVYRPAEQFKVQALNDFLIFSLQGIAALSSGVILVNLGWNWLIVLSLPFLVLLLLLLMFVPKQEPQPA